jgi:hypothetical protein
MPERSLKALGFVANNIAIPDGKACCQLSGSMGLSDGIIIDMGPKEMYSWKQTDRGK